MINYIKVLASNADRLLFKVNGYTFRGSNCAIFIFASFFKGLFLMERKNGEAFQ